MEKIKNICNNKKFEISTPTWNNKSELPDESCSVSDIQDYFAYILKKNIMKRLIIHQQGYM